MEERQPSYRYVKVNNVALDLSATELSNKAHNANLLLTKLVDGIRQKTERTFVLISCDNDREFFVDNLRTGLRNRGSPCLLAGFDRIHEEVEPFRSVLHGFVQSIWQEIHYNVTGKGTTDVILSSVARFVGENWRSIFESHPEFEAFREGIAVPDLGDSLEQLFSVLDSMSIERVANWIPKLLQILTSATEQPLTTVLDDIDVASEPSKKVLLSIMSETQVPAVFIGLCSNQECLGVDNFVSSIESMDDWNVIKLSAADDCFRNFLDVFDRKESNHDLRSLPNDVREVIAIASCFGRSVPFSLLQRAVSDHGVLDSKLLAEYGLARRRYFGEDEFYFSSTFMSPKVYAEIEDKPRIHLRIARRLVEKGILDFDRYSWYFNFVPFHIRRGLDAVLSEERCRLLEVCLEQGGKAVKQTQFSLAWAWLEVGVNLLDRNCWKEEYHLALAVATGAVEVAYARGEHEDVLDLVGKILQNARGIDDTLMAQVMMSYSYDAVGREAEALECCLSTLNDLGENFSKSPRKLQVGLRYTRAKRMIDKAGINSLRSLPPMSDARELSKMQLLAAAVAISYRPRPVLAALLTIRMVELTVEHGGSSISAYALCLFGTMVASYGSKLKQGSLYGEVGLALLSRFKSREWISRVYVAAYAVLYAWNRPLKANLPHLKLSFQASMWTGDTNVSAFNYPSSTACSNT